MAWYQVNCEKHGIVGNIKDECDLCGICDSCGGSNGATTRSHNVDNGVFTVTLPCDCQEEPQERHDETLRRAVKSAFDTQVGGTHYTKLAIQPMEYSFRNNLDPCQHTIIKYVTRFRDKGGKQDLEKAIDCINMLIEMEYGKQE